MFVGASPGRRGEVSGEGEGRGATTFVLVCAGARGPSRACGSPAAARGPGRDRGRCWSVCRGSRASAVRLYLNAPCVRTCVVASVVVGEEERDFEARCVCEKREDVTRRE